MIRHARDIPDGALIECDLCIVGAGAAGITIARALTGTVLRVVLLESGHLTPDPGTQSLSRGRTTGQPYFALDAARSRRFGGTTDQWSGECRPLDAQDFAVREWVPDSGWPFGLEELLPYYHRAHDVVQLGPYRYSADEWREAGVRPAALDGERVESGAFQYSPPTRFGTVYREALRLAPNISTYLGANVVELETPSPPQQVSAVRVCSLEGPAFRVAARAVVLAAGGIENARLLLLSDRVQTAGLGNTHDLVGRYFMEHLYLDDAASLRTRAEAISAFYAEGQWIAGRRVRGIFALSPEVRQRERLTNFCAVLVPPWEGRRLRRIRRAFAKLSGRRPLQTLRVKNVMEQAPHRDSRVTLDTDRDQLGCRRVSLDWRLSEIDRFTAHRGHEILREEFSRSGIGEFRSAMGSERDPWPVTLRGARHHIGTTRMHTDPRRGVVDADGRVHGVANLYVAGSSVFPTSGAANPTLTVVALALRLADLLHRRLA